MDEIRIALVGLGGRGLHWHRLTHRMEGYRVVALCDRIKPLHEAALEIIHPSRDIALYTDYEDVLVDDKVEAVALCVRNPRQGLMAAQALEAGKHVNMEVPAAHSIDDCGRIVLAVERSGKVFQLGEETRFYGFVDAWGKLIAEGKLGRVTYSEGQYIGYYGTGRFFQDPETGRFYPIEELAAHPEAKPTWLHQMPPIHYLPNELSPMLKILDDRVIEVTAMSTRRPSYSHPEIGQPDIQVALMKTEKDAILRLVTGFTQPVPQNDHHWYQVIGTRGRLEWRRSLRERPEMWLARAQMHDFADVEWRCERTDAPPAAKGSGHGDADYYVHAVFRDALLHGQQLEFDVYKAIETAAPAILAAESIDRGSHPMKVPDFRPGPARQPGQPPAET